MKLYVSADLEGMAGIVLPEQCYPEDDRVPYDAACQLMAREVTCVAETLLSLGATEILINDAHGRMTNLAYDTLPDRVSLLSGKPKICAMMAGLDPTYDAALLLGYHAKAGTQAAVLAHTFHHKLFDVRINGVSLGEGGINALHAGLTYGVPVVFGSGDAAFCAEIVSHVPDIETVTTKWGVSYTAARHQSWGELKESYREVLKSVVARRSFWRESLPKPSATGYTLDVTLIHPLAADTALMMPWLTRVDGCTVRYPAASIQEAYQALQSLYAILCYHAPVGC